MSRLVFLRLLVVLIILVGAAQLIAAKIIKASAATSFTFSAVGDFGYTNNTKAVLKALGTSGVDFHLAIGDLNYDYPRVSAQQWSGYVTGAVGQTVPFEIVAGEHDTADITQLETLLPDRIGTITGTYGEQYFFDYPPAAPLARFIMASPGVLGAYAYKKGQADYNWVATAIDDCRHSQILFCHQCAGLYGSRPHESPGQQKGGPDSARTATWLSGQQAVGTQSTNMSQALDEA